MLDLYETKDQTQQHMLSIHFYSTPYNREYIANSLVNIVHDKLREIGNGVWCSNLEIHDALTQYLAKYVSSVTLKFECESLTPCLFSFYFLWIFDRESFLFFLLFFSLFSSFFFFFLSISSFSFFSLLLPHPFLWEIGFQHSIRSPLRRFRCPLLRGKE